MRLDFSALMIATKLALCFGGIIFALAWMGLMPPLPLWLQIYVGASVSFTFLFFVTRRFVPPTPVVAGSKSCPRCDKTLHYTGFECPDCGVVSFENDVATKDLSV